MQHAQNISIAGRANLWLKPKPAIHMLFCKHSLYLTYEALTTTRFNYGKPFNDKEL